MSFRAWISMDEQLHAGHHQAQYKLSDWRKIWCRRDNAMGLLFYMANAAADQDILDIFMLPALEEQFGESCFSMTVPLCTKQIP